VRLLRQDLSLGSAVITAPSFDHALKDPILDAISIRAHDRIILIEGLYTLLSIDPWREAAELLDERWLLEVDTDEERERLVKRHVLSGVTRDADEAAWRAEYNDIPSESAVHQNLFPSATIACPRRAFCYEQSGTSDKNYAKRQRSYSCSVAIRHPNPATVVFYCSCTAVHRAFFSFRKAYGGRWYVHLNVKRGQVLAKDSLDNGGSNDPRVEAKASHCLCLTVDVSRLLLHFRLAPRETLTCQ
jgi:hypothetical protein